MEPIIIVWAVGVALGIALNTNMRRHLAAGRRSPYLRQTPHLQGAPNHNDARLLQKAKDAELAAFVANGNRAWALARMEERLGIAQEQVDASEDMVDALNIISDPFDF